MNPNGSELSSNRMKSPSTVLANASIFYAFAKHSHACGVFARLVAVHGLADQGGGGVTEREEGGATKTLCFGSR